MTLTADQMRHVQLAASVLPRFQRDHFLRSLIRCLRPSDADVLNAISLVLSGRGVSAPKEIPHALRR
jgi:hypothetical protein